MCNIFKNTYEAFFWFQTAKNNTYLWTCCETGYKVVCDVRYEMFFFTQSSSKEVERAGPCGAATIIAFNGRLDKFLKNDDEFLYGLIYLLIPARTDNHNHNIGGFTKAKDMQEQGKQ